MTDSTALIVFSGGQDSTTCLYAALQEHKNVHLLTFNYGQRHAAEIQSAKAIAALVGDRVLSHETIDLGANVLSSTSPLVSDSELEQYADHASLPGGIEKTFVPMRNLLFLTIAYNRAVALGCHSIYTGVCQEDNGGYPDCRALFIEATQVACDAAVEGSVIWSPIIQTPLMNLSKAESVDLALELDGCYEALAYSHTAYDGQYPPLGNDHATLLRARGFEEAGVPDPLVLRASLERRMKLPDTENYMRDDIRDFYTKAGFLT